MKCLFHVFDMSASTKSLSMAQMNSRSGVTEKQLVLFMQIAREGLVTSNKTAMDGKVEIDELVQRDEEKGKIVKKS